MKVIEMYQSVMNQIFKIRDELLEHKKIFETSEMQEIRDSVSIRFV
jgi:hypothetical protein